MGIVVVDDKQLTLFYSSEHSFGKQLYAYIHVSDKKILGVDISKTGVTATQWATLADELQITIKNQVATDHPDFKKHYRKESIDLEDKFCAFLVRGGLSSFDTTTLNRFLAPSSKM